jgi:hypothetical protein
MPSTPIAPRTSLTASNFEGWMIASTLVMMTPQIRVTGALVRSRPGRWSQGLGMEARAEKSAY